MFPSDPSFNEMYVREHQLRMGGVMLWLKELADEQDPKLANEIINNLIELIEVDNILSYFVNYERSCNDMLNKARLQNAKQIMEINTLKDEVKALQYALDEAAKNL